MCKNAERAKAFEDIIEIMRMHATPSKLMNYCVTQYEDAKAEVVTNVLPFGRRGSPEVLLRSMLSEASGMRCVLTVSYRDDGVMRTEWSDNIDKLHAMGLVALLQHNVMIEVKNDS
jgi:hypothetical protein